MPRLSPLLIASLLSMLTVSCGSGRMLVYNVRGQIVGEVRLAASGASIVDSFGNTKGKMIGRAFLDTEGYEAGSLSTGNADEMLILGSNGTAVGSLLGSADCHARDQALLGRIAGNPSREAAAAACFFLLLERR